MWLNYVSRRFQDFKEKNNAIQLQSLYHQVCIIKYRTKWRATSQILLVTVLWFMFDSLTCIFVHYFLDSEASQRVSRRPAPPRVCSSFVLSYILQTLIKKQVSSYCWWGWWIEGELYHACIYVMQCKSACIESTKHEAYKLVLLKDPFSEDLLRVTWQPVSGSFSLLPWKTLRPRTCNIFGTILS